MVNTARRSRKESKLETRERILDSALEVLIKEGTKGFSMNKVAKAAGIAQPSFYNHFDSLDEMLAAMFEKNKERYFLPYKNAFIALIPEATEENIFDIFTRMYFLALELMASQSDLYRMMLEERVQRNSEFGHLIRMFIDDIQEEWISTAINIGLIADTPENRASWDMGLDGMFSLLEGYAIRYMDGKYESVDEPVRLMANFTMDFMEKDLQKFFAMKKQVQQGE